MSSKIVPIFSYKSFCQSEYPVVTEPVAYPFAFSLCLILTQHQVMCSAGKSHFPGSLADGSQCKTSISLYEALSGKLLCFSPFHFFLPGNSYKMAGTQQLCCYDASFRESNIQSERDWALRKVSTK